VTSTLFFLSVVVGFVFYLMRPEERARALRVGMAAIRSALIAIGYAKDAAIEDLRRPDPFRDALRARTSWAVITPALVVLNVAIYTRMIFEEGPISEPQTLIAWGGNFGPSTTNGEWFRLVTALFVHAGLLQLLVDTVALVQIGLLLERLIGPFAFTSVYLGTGVLVNLVNLSQHPVTVTVGFSGAVFGVYGLFLAQALWGLLHRSPVTIPLRALKRLAVPVLVFVLYNMATNGLGSPAIVGLATGCVSGLMVVKGVNERKPTLRQVTIAAAAILLVTVVSAVFLRGMTDARPEIVRLVAVEERIATLYQKAVGQFRNGRMSANELARLIDQTIMPELQAVRARLTALDRVPREQQTLVARAQEYLRLRDESWRLRSEGLHKSTLPTLTKAERPERAALEVLEKIRPPDQK
jgi:membrane associated rhomboid family serine protease